MEARLQDWAERAALAQNQAKDAFARLLELAETRDSGQVRRVAQFLASTYNGEAFPFNLYELRAVDIEISDDMLSCLDALRWAKADLFSLVPEGDKRVRAVIEAWGLTWPVAS